jgi:hypothetical protein
VLKAAAVNAVENARKTFIRGGLLVSVPVIHRVADTHVPGQPQTFTETSDKMSLCITAYEEKEIDGTSIKATDLRALLFPQDGVIAVTDYIIFRGTKYRILRDRPTFAGDTILVNTLQLRPIGIP